jgi:hypothetical protein
LRPKILEEHDDELIVLINKKVKTIPNNAYTILRKMHMDDNRIIYTFAPFVTATETYNDRIFNLVYDKFLITVRQDLANEVCETILDHYKKGDYTKFKEMFLRVYSHEHQDELVQKFIQSLSNDIKIETKLFHHNTGDAACPVYIIGGKFAIDAGGTSYFYRESDKSWTFLCTVVTGETQSYRVKMGDIGWAKLTPKMSGIIAKVVFFLNPNAKDGVFTSQLKGESPRLYSEIQDGSWLKGKT